MSTVADSAHAPVSGENAWRRVLRATQSTWREGRGLDAAEITVGGARRRLGSRLTDHDAEAGRNFLTETTWQRVQKELEANEAAPSAARKMMTATRLKDNLLSSQPLCFNLFAELSADLGLATRALRLVWPDVIGRVEAIEFEWSPGRDDETYLGNRSAFDVAVFYSAAGGRRGILGIEVKYHEDLRAVGGELRDRAVEVAHDAGLPLDVADPTWSRAPLNQLLLDHLLALSITQHQKRPWGTADFCLLYPAVNAACHAAVAEYRGRLGYLPAFHATTLETLIGALRSTTEEPWVEAFHDRYLAYGRAFFVGQGIERPLRRADAVRDWARSLRHSGIGSDEL